MKFVVYALNFSLSQLAILSALCSVYSRKANTMRIIALLNARTIFKRRSPTKKVHLTPEVILA